MRNSIASDSVYLDVMDTIPDKPPSPHVLGKIISDSTNLCNAAPPAYTPAFVDEIILDNEKVNVVPHVFDSCLSGVNDTSDSNEPDVPFECPEPVSAPQSKNSIN